MSSNIVSQGAHAFTTSTGATLTYFVTGHGPRTVLNVAPGWGSASLLYQNWFKFLEHAFTFVHLEVRGTRGSSFPPSLRDMSSWHMAEDVDSLRAHLGLETADVWGHSNGGCIALWYGIRFPTRVRTLVLLDAQPLGASDVEKPAIQAILDGRPERDAVAAVARFVPAQIESDEEMGEILGAMLPLYLARPERDMEKFTAAFNNPLQIACARNQYAAEEQHNDQIQQTGEVTARTLVVVGRDDFICPVPVSQAIAAGVKDATLHIIDDCGHLPWLEQQQQFTEILFSFYSMY